MSGGDGSELSRALQATRERRDAEVRRLVMMLADNRYATLTGALRQAFQAGVEACLACDRDGT